MGSASRMLKVATQAQRGAILWLHLVGTGGLSRQDKTTVSVSGSTPTSWDASLLRAQDVGDGAVGSDAGGD
jgi:hypothetical protein